MSTTKLFAGRAFISYSEAEARLSLRRHDPSGAEVAVRETAGVYEVSHTSAGPEYVRASAFCADEASCEAFLDDCDTRMERVAREARENAEARERTGRTGLALMAGYGLGVAFTLCLGVIAGAMKRA